MSEPTHRDFEEYVLREHPKSMAAARIRHQRAMAQFADALRPHFEAWNRAYLRFAQRISRR